ncbi:MAG: polysaccharide biosynthesis/export family protein [Candidatus Saganbacteria bacterium]|nr:polysaccharide biosynthesis/export family protein [Candidatus Saganbacteria bacterium]
MKITRKLICLFLIITTLLGFGILDLGFASEYILSPSDLLEIHIIGQKDLDTKQTISPDGTISLPLIGIVTAQGQTRRDFNKYLTTEFSKYIKNPQVVVYLTPRSIYVIQHNLKDNTWEVKEAKSIEEARALVGKDYTGEIKYGDTITVDVGKQPDWWEDNWYKVVTGIAVVVGIYATLHTR